MTEAICPRIKHTVRPAHNFNKGSSSTTPASKKWFRYMESSRVKSVHYCYEILRAETASICWALFEEKNAPPPLVFYCVRIFDDVNKARLCEGTASGKEGMLDTYKVLLILPVWTSVNNKMWRRVGMGEIVPAGWFDEVKEEVLCLIEGDAFDDPFGPTPA